MSVASALQSFAATPHSAALSVLDTAATVSANIDGLQGIAAAGKLLQLQLSDSDGAVSLSLLQYEQDKALLGDLTGNYTLHLTGVTMDSAVIVGQPHVASIAVADASYNLYFGLSQLETLAENGELPESP